MLLIYHEQLTNVEMFNRNIKGRKKTHTKKVPSIGCIDKAENEQIRTQKSYIRMKMSVK